MFAKVIANSGYVWSLCQCFYFHLRHRLTENPAIILGKSSSQICSLSDIFGNVRWTLRTPSVHELVIGITQATLGFCGVTLVLL